MEWTSLQYLRKFKSQVEHTQTQQQQQQHNTTQQQHNTTVAYQAKALGLVLIAVPQGRRAAAGYHADQRQLHSETKRNYLQGEK